MWNKIKFILAVLTLSLVDKSIQAAEPVSPSAHMPVAAACLFSNQISPQV